MILFSVKREEKYVRRKTAYNPVHWKERGLGNELSCLLFTAALEIVVWSATSRNFLLAVIVRR